MSVTAENPQLACAMIMAGGSTARGWPISGRQEYEKFWRARIQFFSIMRDKVAPRGTAEDSLKLCSILLIICFKLLILLSHVLFDLDLTQMKPAM
jgi:mannose-1-phosphate guanylyltransferase